MKALQCIILVYYVQSIVAQSHWLVFKDKVEYLEKLIYDTVNASTTYQQAKNNNEFFRNVSDDGRYKDFGEFDFIIVGAGSSGSALAYRLSEICNWNILVLEAGQNDDDLTDIPYINQILHGTDRNWGYLTTPQKEACFSRKNNQCPFPRGKVLGGSGTINALGYSRGNRKIFDEWGKKNPGWSFRDVIKYFKRMENYDNRNANWKYRGFAGPIDVSYNLPSSRIMQIVQENPTMSKTIINQQIRDISLAQIFPESNEITYFNRAVSSNIINATINRQIIAQNFFNIVANVSGLPVIDDYNAEEQNGLSQFQLTLKHGKRVSGASAYIRESWQRFNLNVTRESLVTKVLINETTKKAYGVEFVHHNVKYRSYAKKEVILSGGSINSPHLLMLSGIGPQEELRKFNINVVKDAPVGVQMKDHLTIQIYFQSNITNISVPLRKLLEIYLLGGGPLANLFNVNGVAFFNSKSGLKNNTANSVPDTELLLNLPGPVDLVLPTFDNFKADAKAYLSSLSRSTCGIQYFNLNLKSYGTLKLKSSNPRDYLSIDSGILTNKEDLLDMLNTLRTIATIASNPQFQAFNLTYYPFKKCCFTNPCNINNDAYWDCYIRHLVQPGWHPSSTTRMGLIDDPLAVVDHKLKVHGVQNLRIVDCGIMPTSDAANINAAAFMIGEKAADMIKDEYNMNSKKTCV